MGLTFFDLLVLVGGPVLGGAVVFVVLCRLGRRAPTHVDIQSIAERVQAVGKLVGLEVAAKEIATATSGWGWLPPLLLSRARLAMIFHFEKQYSVDLAAIRKRDVSDLGGGRFRLQMPPIRGDLRLTDVVPYDIQDGRVLGLLDVIQMNADRQKELMKKAQEQAAQLFEHGDGRYLAEAKASIDRQLRALLSMFDVDVEVVWPEGEAATDEPPVVADLRSARGGSLVPA